MAAPLVKLIDRAVIRMARLHLEKRVYGNSHLAEAKALLEEQDFFGNQVEPVDEMKFFGSFDFSCNSPVAGVAPQSSQVYGKFYRCGDNWRKRPVVIMLHGWNGENCYRLLFPLLARYCCRHGINLLMFELPCHGRRRAPSGAGSDFISADLSAMVKSTRQAIADTRALLGWLKQEGCGPIGVWGISLGAWLAGLLVCNDERLKFAVVMSPIVRMDRAIEELEFCVPIRRSLAGREIPFHGLNLVDHRPLTDRGNLLLLEGRHDVFAPQARVEELWEIWERPPIERFNHGHISILVSWKAMRRALRFIEDRAP
ncbi:alpha/beta hydrolase [Desulfopila inferna]|uniref:alpha/beta hydrolase n=1 Tax=Desulfopila inferna TaxID=468528 RepID=UPI001F05D5BC|nr:alpha/beta hydrolase [Desulfopila inferna]